MTQDRADINTYLPMELFRAIFLYCIEVHQVESGDLASVCRHWRAVITSIASLWSTLRIGTWTETERVATWLQRAYPKRVIIDTQRDRGSPSEAPACSALQNALTNTDQWQELTICSFPSGSMATRIGIQSASPMNTLKVLNLVNGCVHTPLLSHLLNLVPHNAPLCELRLHVPSASAHFLQPQWFPVLVNLTVLIVSGRDIHEPFELLPAFIQLQIFEADRLLLPFYEPNTDLPLLSTLRKLQLRACSVQWMAGRQFSCLEECAILLPRHWEVIQQNEVGLPSCKKLTYHGHPMTTAGCFIVPKMRAMELRSHDCNSQRVCQQLLHLCRVDNMVSNLTTLHLTFQCNERALIKVLKYLVPLRELVLSVTHPSSSWQNFLESLAAKPSTNRWPARDPWMDSHRQWKQWCSSQTWRADVLPHLKYLGIQCPKGFSQSYCFDNRLLLRLAGWTRSRLTPPLEHLKVWEGRGTKGDIVVDYISTGYLDEYLGISSKEYDAMVIMGVATRHLVFHVSASPLFNFYSTILFRQLQGLKLIYGHNHQIPILPYLKQIKWLEIWSGIIPVYPLNLDFPLINTLQWLKLCISTPSWMIGRSFKALKEFEVDGPYTLVDLSGFEGLQVDLPACTTLKLYNCSNDFLHFLSCPNIQNFHFQRLWLLATDKAPLESLTNFLCNCSCLEGLEVNISEDLGRPNSLIQFVFCDAWEQEVWKDIKSVEVKIRSSDSSRKDEYQSFTQRVGQQYYEKRWKEFTVTKDDRESTVVVRACT